MPTTHVTQPGPRAIERLVGNGLLLREGFHLRTTDLWRGLLQRAFARLASVGHQDAPREQLFLLALRERFPLADEDELCVLLELMMGASHPPAPRR